MAHRAFHQISSNVAKTINATNGTLRMQMHRASSVNPSKPQDVSVASTVPEVGLMPHDRHMRYIMAYRDSLADKDYPAQTARIVETAASKRFAQSQVPVSGDLDLNDEILHMIAKTKRTYLEPRPRDANVLHEMARRKYRQAQLHLDRLANSNNYYTFALRGSRPDADGETVDTGGGAVAIAGVTVGAIDGVGGSGGLRGGSSSWRMSAETVNAVRDQYVRKYSQVHMKLQPSQMPSFGTVDLTSVPLEHIKRMRLIRTPLQDKQRRGSPRRKSKRNTTRSR